MLRSTILLATLLLAPAVAPAQTDSAQAVETVARFHAALARGDSTGALATLAPDALVLEGGAMETRHEYHHHHLPGDIDFARAVAAARTVEQVTVRGDVAWIVSTSESKGSFKGRAINSTGVELVVLTKHDGSWRISTIHWSSRARRTN